MPVELCQIHVDPLQQMLVVLSGQRLAVQIPQGQFLGQQFVENNVFIGFNGLVDAAVGKGTGGNQLSLILSRSRDRVFVSVR